MEDVRVTRPRYIRQHWCNTACCYELTEFPRIESGETYPDFDTWTAICQTFDLASDVCEAAVGGSELSECSRYALGAEG